MEYDNAIRMVNITKIFGTIVANRNVSFEIRHGEIMALLGENGSGKTTLMNMLAGIYYPDDGEIFVEDQEVSIRSPKDALDLKIGMIHQHFKLIDVFTAADNIILGLPGSALLNRKKILMKIKALCEKYGFDIDLNQKIYNMNVSQKQTLEIVKALYRGADTLILDEPTAVLTPQETEKLFAVIRNMRADGKAIVIITHKLHEVLTISDRVTVLRKGEYVGVIETEKANEQILTEMMVGKKVELNIERPQPVNPVKRLDVRNLNLTDADGRKILKDISFELYGGEILGIAGISGCGQKELLEAIAGLQKVDAGSEIIYYEPGKEAEEKSLLSKTPKQIKNLGISLSFVPEDRLGMVLVSSMGMADNMMLKTYERGMSLLTERKKPYELAEKIKKELEVITPSVTVPVRTLSGGNVQKVLVGREIAAAPTVLMTAYAVRGLDINTSYTIYHLLNEQKKKGVAVLYVGEDLDVLLALCDRILVLSSGEVTGIEDGRSVTKERIGFLMTTTSGGKESGKNA